MSAPERKADLRRQALARLRSMAPEERSRASKALADRLLERPEVAAAGCILGFAPLNSEPGLEDALETLRADGRRVLLPRAGAEPGVLEAVELVQPINSLEPDALGVRTPSTGEPVPSGAIELVLVPGLMFDTWGQRLGRGGGYYDRLLERLPAARLIGTCFEASMCERVPVEPHDHRVDLVVTDERTIDCVSQRPSKS
ncbi:MAG: 5-formyltetrahydrofolate cyclo-ligase [Phycisphaerales bacterium]|nr:5-formyltetrahydrofolate cyclo-ligase [Phycisphaerales bacterium]